MLALLFARAVSADKNHKIGLCTDLLNHFKEATLVSTMAKKLDMEAPHLTLSADLIYNPSVESADLNAKSPKMPVTILSATEDKEKSTVKGRARFGEKGFEVRYTCHKNSVGDNIHFHVKALNQALVPAVCDLLEYMVRLRMPIKMDKSMLSYDDKHEILNVQLHGGEWPDFAVAVKFTAVQPKTRMTNYFVSGTAEVGSKSVAFQCHAGSRPVHDPFHIHFYKLSKEDVSKAEAKQTKGASSEIPYGMISLMFFLASAILACSMFGAAYLYRKKQKLTPKAPAPAAPAAPTAGELV